MCQNSNTWNKGETKYTNEKIAKMSEDMKGHKRNVGRVHSQKIRNKLSENSFGKNNNFFGKTHTDEVKIRMSEKRRGLKCITNDLENKFIKVDQNTVLPFGFRFGGMKNPRIKLH
jgi:FAD synthase